MLKHHFFRPVVKALNHTPISKVLAVLSSFFGSAAFHMYAVFASTKDVLLAFICFMFFLVQGALMLAETSTSPLLVAYSFCCVCVCVLFRSPVSMSSIYFFVHSHCSRTENLKLA